MTITCRRNLLRAAVLFASRWLSIGMVIRTVRAQSEDRHADRLVSITYSLLDKRLYGDIAHGHYEGSTFIIDRMGEQYAIDPVAGTMSLDAETRGFDKETAEREKENLQKVLNLLARYMADSIVWWREGNGEKLVKSARRAD